MPVDYNLLDKPMRMQHAKATRLRKKAEKIAEEGQLSWLE